MQPSKQQEIRREDAAEGVGEEGRRWEGRVLRVAVASSDREDVKRDLDLSTPQFG